MSQTATRQARVTAAARLARFVAVRSWNDLSGAAREELKIRGSSYSGLFVTLNRADNRMSGAFRRREAPAENEFALRKQPGAAGA